MKIYNKETGILMADPGVLPFKKGLPSYEDILKSRETMILSSSGWRKIFAVDGEEESTTPEVSDADKIIAGIAALTFAQYIKERCRSNGKTSAPLLLIGTDSRPTGPVLSDTMIRVFLSEGLEVRHLFITAAPEIMAYSATTEESDGFAYISASHNPIGHNGFKFGLEGGVIGGKESKQLIDSFLKHLSDSNIAAKISELTENADKDKYEKILLSSHKWKNEAYRSYLAFAKRTISDSEEPEEQDKFFSAISETAESRPAGVIGELNGSARSLSIDAEIITEAGVKCMLFNNTPGKVVHRIVPEGFSLDPCRELLEKANRKDPSYILGYVPDNDGDRGNIVYIDSTTGKAEILEAQEVFALAVLSELSFAFSKKERNNSGSKLAVAVNGPTSMRIDRIAEAFEAETFRAEVGEANVVTLAQSLRDKGYIVRILGEGSNGGNITHPAKVRDPINTVFSLLKILLYKVPGTEHDLFKIWCRQSGQEDKYRDNYTLSDVISTLPAYTTTSAYEKRAIMKIRSSDHNILKSRYEKIFLSEWEKNKEYLRDNFDIHSWKEINYEGIKAVSGMGSEYRTGKGTGGLKIIFMDAVGKETNYIWMRGSGTEPVFRILADVSGKDYNKEEWLLNWHRKMIERADKGEEI